MEFQDHGDKQSKIQLLYLILNHSFENGWITEKEKLRIETKETFKDKQFELFKLIRNMESEDNAARLFWSMRCFNEMNEILNEMGWDGNQFLSLIMSKVFEKGLITEEEKLAFDSKLSIETAEHVTGKHPMKIELIIRCILKYLNVKDIGICRRISKQWSILGLNFLTSRARIVFMKLDNIEDSYTGNKTPEGFFETFDDEFSKEFRDPEYSETVPFTAFRLYSTADCSWTIEELDEFFYRQQSNIRELKLEELHLEDEYGETLEHFDITGWIAESPLAQPDTKYNTKLEIDYDDEVISDLRVSSDALRGVKILKLKNCEVHLTEQKISPVELALSCVSFFRDLNKLPVLCINDAFDLSNVKKINLDCDADETYYELDMTGELSLEYLNAPHILLRNWDVCKWTVQKFDVAEDPFIEKTEMEINELNLSESNVDISVLPHSIQKLSIEHIRWETCTSSEPFSFDSKNLRYLRLHFVTNCCISTISHFIHCSNLIALELENKKSIQYDIDVSWIPHSVKRLKLLGFRVTNPNESETFHIEKLVLSKYSFQEIETICCSYFKTRELVLFLKISESSRMLSILGIENSYPQFLQRIYVGRFNWSGAICSDEDEDYEEIPLSKYVDFKSEYYVFENGRGRAIDRLEFEKTKEIQAD